MKKSKRLRIAIQKKGRLNSDCMDLLSRCGLKINTSQNSLLCHVENLPIDLLFVRDDDIPTLVLDQVCDLGIVGENVLNEQTINVENDNLKANYEIINKLGFSRCRLSIAIPEDCIYSGPSSLNNMRIATSYPNLLRDYLKRQNINAEIMMISGSVEIAPKLDMADAICDLVSTGRTLEENNLKEVDEILQSQAVLIKNKSCLSDDKAQTLSLLLRRIEGVLKAQESKYIMFHLPKASLASITKLIPGCETPTIIPLDGISTKVVVHAVSTEGIFWSTLEKLKLAGASSILVLPIEKMMN